MNNTGLLLILLGIGLLTSEAFVPGYGILGMGGVSVRSGLAVSDRYFANQPGGQPHINRRRHA